MLPTGTVANYSVMVNTPAGGRCAHKETKYCQWQNITNSYCGNNDALAEPVGCWPDDVQFQLFGPQKLYVEGPGFVDFAAGNCELKPDAQQVFKDFPVTPFADIGPGHPRAASGTARALTSPQAAAVCFGGGANKQARTQLAGPDVRTARQAGGGTRHAASTVDVPRANGHSLRSVKTHPLKVWRFQLLFAVPLVC
jgi:hypothetical protein